MDLDKAIRSRHSTKKFSSKKPDWRDIIESIDAARFAPMAGSNYSLKFILVSEEEKIAELAKISQQDFISKAQYAVVVCSNPSRTKNAYGKSGEIYLRQQAGAAIENFILKLQEYGLGTCWIGHFVEEQVKHLLQIPEHVQVEAILPIGYEGEKKHTRKAPIEMDNILYFESYGEKRMIKKRSMDV